MLILTWISAVYMCFSFNLILTTGQGKLCADKAKAISESSFEQADVTQFPLVLK